MKCEQVREQFPDYLIEEIAASTRAEIDAHLGSCAACREEVASLNAIRTRLASLPDEEPSPASATNFHAMLEAYRQGMKEATGDSSRRRTLADWLGGLWPQQRVLQFAIAILLFAFGVLIRPSFARLQEQRVGFAATNDPAIARLRQEVSDMRQLVALALLQQASASERLRGVQWSHRLAQPDEQVLSALLRALDSDPNVNVRLAAVDALEQFARNAQVKKGLLDSLPRQNSPLVQIELINLMVELQEKESVPVLRTLLQNSELNESVRERAEWGLQRLG